MADDDILGEVRVILKKKINKGKNKQKNQSTKHKEKNKGPNETKLLKVQSIKKKYLAYKYWKFLAKKGLKMKGFIYFSPSLPSQFCFSLQSLSHWRPLFISMSNNTTDFGTAWTGCLLSCFQEPSIVLVNGESDFSTGPEELMLRKRSLFIMTYSIIISNVT